MQIITLSASEQPQTMQQYLPHVWAVLVASYASVAGGLHFSDPQALLEESACWRLAVDGDVVAVVTYKAKKGLKLGAMGICPHQRAAGREGLKTIIREDLPHCWMELSEGAEQFVLKHCQGERYLIHNSLIPQLLDKDEVEPALEDAFHYRREICGIHKHKIALGTPVF